MIEQPASGKEGKVSEVPVVTAGPIQRAIPIVLICLPLAMVAWIVVYMMVMCEQPLDKAAFAQVPIGATLHEIEEAMGLRYEIVRRGDNDWKFWFSDDEPVRNGKAVELIVVYFRECPPVTDYAAFFLDADGRVIDKRIDT